MSACGVKVEGLRHDETDTSLGWTLYPFDTPAEVADFKKRIDDVWKEMVKA
jgi:hypothetical protein